jgi:penicillin-binding protein 1B
MMDLSKASPREYEQARAEPLRVVNLSIPVRIAPYFVDYVRQQLQELYPPHVLESEGLTIYTALHPEMAMAADTVIKEGLQEIEKTYPRLQSDNPKDALQAVLIAVQPKTGVVLALVGGRDYGESNFNRALYAYRQPGSAIKPFIYLSALDQFTPVSWIPDEPVAYKVGGVSWIPKNYGGQYHGRVTLRQSLEQSLNAATVSLAMESGLVKAVSTLRSLGITTPLQPVPSLALGAFEVSPIELAGAFATLDNDGQKPYLLSLKEVVTEQGEMQQRRHVEFSSVTTPAKAFLITSLLEGAVERGTGKIVRRLGINFPCAGKTGTTSDYKDSWFAGYTTDLLVLVWVGFDDNRPTNLSGAQGAARLWVRFFNKVRPWIHPQPFRVPPGVVQRDICTESGEMATRSCYDKRLEYFLPENVPDHACTLHTGP